MPLPPVGAFIKYTGAGRLKGRWEVVLPGDSPPSEFDLLTAATLPVEQRNQQDATPRWSASTFFSRP